MLGLSNTIPYANVIGGFDPLSIPNCVAWYDFSDASTLWQDVGRTTQTIPGDASANSIGGNKYDIGAIDNKVTGSALNKLGTFVRSRSDDESSQSFKTRAFIDEDGYPYALTNTGATYTGLCAGNYTNLDAGEDLLDWGCATTGKLSDISLNTHELTVFAICRGVSSSTIGPHYSISYTGYDGSAGSGTDTSWFTMGWDTNENSTISMISVDQSPIFETIAGSLDFDNFSMGTKSRQLQLFRGAPGVNATRSRFAGSSGPTGSIDHDETTTSTLDVNYIGDMSQDVSSGKVCKFCIGTSSMATQALNAISGSFESNLIWGLGLHEFIVYNRTLTEQEVTNVTNYLTTKHRFATMLS